MEEEINCFYCQKMISVKAKKCPYCQEWVPASVIKQINKMNKPPKQPGNGPKIIKGILLGVFIGSTWFISIPAGIFYYYKKHTFNKDTLEDNFQKYKIESITIVLTLFFIFVGSLGEKNRDYSYNSGSSSYTAPTPPPKPQEVVFNSAWDGSVYQVKDYLDKILKDPKSYESMEWSNVQKHENGFTVRHKFRAKNSFGGYEITEYIFSLDKNGNIIDAVKI